MRTRETEVKIRVANLPALRKRLTELGFRLLHPRALEDNLLFDTPDRALRGARSILRLRRYGVHWIVTFKGTPDTSRGYKSRLELETQVENPAAIGQIFEILGFQPVFRYQKYRAQYVTKSKRTRHPVIEVAVDETPVGTFLELEGRPASIDRVARALGYSPADYSTASYGALYLEECRRKNVPPGDMVFAGSSRRK